MRITTCLDNYVLQGFRDRAVEEGRGYQTMKNEALREYLGKAGHPLDEEALRRILLSRTQERELIHDRLRCLLYPAARLKRSPREGGGDRDDRLEDLLDFFAACCRVSRRRADCLLRKYIPAAVDSSARPIINSAYTNIV
jgi:hypothetical protein